MIELGGNIELAGFKDFDPQSLIVIKKIVGNYTKRFNEIAPVEKLTLTSKKIHERESSSLYEIQAKLVAKGNITNSATTDRNLFFAVDTALKKLEKEVSR